MSVLARRQQSCLTDKLLHLPLLSSSLYTLFQILAAECWRCQRAVELFFLPAYPGRRFSCFVVTWVRMRNTKFYKSEIMHLERQATSNYKTVPTYLVSMLRTVQCSRNYIYIRWFCSSWFMLCALYATRWKIRTWRSGWWMGWTQLQDWTNRTKHFCNISSTTSHTMMPPVWCKDNTPLSWNFSTHWWLEISNSLCESQISQFPLLNPD